jgi:hypothetical protein
LKIALPWILAHHCAQWAAVPVVVAVAELFEVVVLVFKVVVVLVADVVTRLVVVELFGSGIRPNHTRSSTERTGTEWPTLNAENPRSFVPSPYTILV